ncbi:hypothetical protein CC80DRAFT_511707 [Byssothecium circinans]|uniref:Ribosomal protein s17 n=1 Tax=Byssothecium circinans TaxID=147558 RepID=A0A6A5UHT2_9PLEO|nr:hypothetical protein CC80DRAFT_511707 [Byssothecium circinans]
MRFSTVLSLLLAAGVVQAQFGKGKGQGKGQQGQQDQQQDAAQQAQGKGKGNGKGNGKNNNNDQNNNNNALALNPDNVQANSNNDGLADAEPGQAASETDPANFINFCTGKTLTNGLQVQGGSCNGIPMGDIPSANNMVSAVMINPKNGDDVEANQAINFQVQIDNLVAGTFTNPDVTYYAAPQTLQGGKVVGHTHITVQDTGNDLNPTQPLDAQTFAFFKGINNDGDGNGLLSANLAEGLPNGNYRVCTMTSSANHQLVLMPIAQRGPQDDCVRFTVGAGNGNNNANGKGKGNGKGQQDAAQQAKGKGNGKGKGQQDQAAADAAQGKGKGKGQQDQAAADAAQGKGKGQGKGQAGAQAAGKGKGGARLARRRPGRFTSRKLVA